MNFFSNILSGIYSKSVGIDISSSAIKIAELLRRGKKIYLKGYGYVDLDSFASFAQIGSSSFDAEFTSQLIMRILREAGIKTKKVVFVVPSAYTACTSFTVPPMPNKALEQAVNFTASQNLTVPVEQVALDWQIVSDVSVNPRGPYEIFLTAIPNLLIQSYKNLAKQMGLELHAIETEALALAKSLAKNYAKTVCLMDIGSKSAIISIAQKGFLKGSQHIQFDSQLLSQVYFLNEELYPLLDPLLAEVDRISLNFLEREQRSIEEIYLSGGLANLPGLKEYIAAHTHKEVYIRNCFADFSYPALLSPNLKEISPSFAVAIGAALVGV